MEHKHKKILIVEDEAGPALAMKDNLVKEGFDVALASNGEDGLTMALREKPDLILLDVLMPKMDGITVMKKLRENDWGKKVPIIILTVLEPDDAMMKAIIENNPAYYLVKSSLKITDIIEKIRTIPGFYPHAE